MADKLPWFWFNARDFLSSSRVKRMSLTEVGVYIQLLSYQWLDGSLPAEIGQLARLVQLPEKRFGRLWTNGVLRECFVERDGRLVNDRLERTRQEADTFRESKVNAGRTSAEVRRRKYGSAQPSNTVRTDAEHTIEQAVRTDAEPPYPHPLPSSSTEPLKNEVLSRARGTPIHPRRRLDAAFDGPRGLYVPQSLHQQFVGLRNHPNADFELQVWYEAVANDWSHGAKKHLEPDADMFRFWRAQYAEKWPPTPAAKPSPNRPAWAVKS